MECLGCLLARLLTSKPSAQSAGDRYATLLHLAEPRRSRRDWFGLHEVRGYGRLEVALMKDFQDALSFDLATSPFRPRSWGEPHPPGRSSASSRGPHSVLTEVRAGICRQGKQCARPGRADPGRICKDSA